MTPQTTLPTEPGFYWFRANPDTDWILRHVHETGPDRFEAISFMDVGKTTYLRENCEMQYGEWIRVPKPE